MFILINAQNNSKSNKRIINIKRQDSLINVREKNKHKSPEDIKKERQIPQKKLRIMSEIDLIRACLKNRLLFVSLYAFRGTGSAFGFAVRKFNGLKELLNRPAAPKKLLDFYKKQLTVAEFKPSLTQYVTFTQYLSFIKDTSYISYEDYLDYKLLDYNLQLFTLEIILAQKSILNKLSKYDRELLLGYTLEKHNDVSKDGFLPFCEFSVGSNLIIGRIMKIDSIGYYNKTNRVMNIINEPDIDRFVEFGIKDKFGIMDRGPINRLRMSLNEHLTKVKVNYYYKTLKQERMRK
jgi:hypothetical protein